jgi:cell division protein FtsL
MLFGIWIILAGSIMLAMCYSLGAAPIFMILCSIIITIGMIYTSHLFDELEKKVEKLENRVEELKKELKEGKKIINE